MTAGEKRIKLARACGWKGIPEQFLVGYSPNRTVPYEWAVRQCPIDDLGSIPLDPLPDYANDLNACQQAWETLDGMQHAQFKHHLGRIVRSQMGTLPRPSVSCATAAQRFEALGITLGLWEA